MLMRAAALPLVLDVEGLVETNLGERNLHATLGEALHLTLG